MESSQTRTLTVQPIGFVRSGGSMKFDAPHQPTTGSTEVNRIELLSGSNFELALQDLVGFDRIWLVSWFDRNSSWRPRVLPPRGPARRRGVFATRSPHRPNPIGLTSVPLLSVSELTLEVGPLDLVDGTPILDIKPYLANVDAWPEASLGWVADLPKGPPAFHVSVSELAAAQLAWLRDEWEIDFISRAFAILAEDPTPHRTRRILHLGNGRYRMACGVWRMFFQVSGDSVEIHEVGKGYSDDSLFTEGWERIPFRDAQVAFGQTWISSSDVR